MKRFFFMVVVIAFGINISNAQSLSIKCSGKIISNDEVITVYGDTTVGAMELYLTVVNNSNEELGVIVKRKAISVLESTINDYCFGVNCYVADQSSPAFNIASGDSTETFHATYYHMGALGTSSIRYTFFDTENPNDSICTVVNYISTGVGVKENVNPVLSFSNAYPNPASSIVSFDYKLNNNVVNSRVVLTDMLGNEVASQEINNSFGKASFDVSSLNSGVYFYSLKINGVTQLTKKVIVK